MVHLVVQETVDLAVEVLEDLEVLILDIRVATVLVALTVAVLGPLVGLALANLEVALAVRTDMEILVVLHLAVLLDLAILDQAVLLDLVILGQAVLAVLETLVQAALVDSVSLGLVVLVTLGTWVLVAPVVLAPTIPAEAVVALGILQVVLAALEMIRTMTLRLGAGLFELVSQNGEQNLSLKRNALYF